MVFKMILQKQNFDEEEWIRPQQKYFAQMITSKLKIIT